MKSDIRETREWQLLARQAGEGNTFAPIFMLVDFFNRTRSTLDTEEANAILEALPYTADRLFDFSRKTMAKHRLNGEVVRSSIDVGLGKHTTNLMIVFDVVMEFVEDVERILELSKDNTQIALSNWRQNQDTLSMAFGLSLASRGIQQTDAIFCSQLRMLLNETPWNRSVCEDCIEMFSFLPPDKNRFSNMRFNVGTPASEPISALHFLSGEGEADEVINVYEKDSDIQDEDGWFPMHYAALNKPEVAMALFNLEAKCGQDNCGKHPADYAKILRMYNGESIPILEAAQLKHEKITEGGVKRKRFTGTL